MRAASERYHLKSLAFFVIVANANCLLVYSPFRNSFTEGFIYISIALGDRSFVEYNVHVFVYFLNVYIWTVDSKEQNKYES